MISRRRRSGDASTGALKNQRHKVAGDEDVSVVFWPNARRRGAIDVDDSGKAQINGCREEGWADSEADEVPGLWID
jgi:hypothetical protein